MDALDEWPTNQGPRLPLCCALPVFHTVQLTWEFGRWCIVDVVLGFHCTPWKPEVKHENHVYMYGSAAMPFEWLLPLSLLCSATFSMHAALNLVAFVVAAFAALVGGGIVVVVALPFAVVYDVAMSCVASASASASFSAVDLALVYDYYVAFVYVVAVWHVRP